MSKFKNFMEFREQFGEYSIAEHLLLGVTSEDDNFDFDKVKKEGLDLKIFINGKEYDFTNLLHKINNWFDKIEKEAETISDNQIEELFREKVSEKLYDILNKLDRVDSVIKDCISYEREEHPKILECTCFNVQKIKERLKDSDREAYDLICAIEYGCDKRDKIMNKAIEVLKEV